MYGHGIYLTACERFFVGKDEEGHWRLDAPNRLWAFTLARWGLTLRRFATRQDALDCLAAKLCATQLEASEWPT